MVVQNLQQAGWNVSTSGNAVIINGHNMPGVGVSGPTEIKAKATNYKESNQPAISATDGVKVGQVIDSSTPWVVSFEPLDSSNPTMTEDVTFNLTVDGTTVNVSLTRV